MNSTGRAISAPERAQLWMRRGADRLNAGHWTAAIEAFGRGLWEEPQLGVHFTAALERARLQHRRHRCAALSQGQTAVAVLVVRTGSDRASLARAEARSRIHARLGHGVESLELVPAEAGAMVALLWQRCLRRPADLVHLCEPTLPAVVCGLLCKLFWGACVVVTVDDRDPASGVPRATIGLETLKRIWGGLPPPLDLLDAAWAGLALQLCRRFDARLASDPIVQQRQGGTLIDEPGEGPALALLCRQLGDGLTAAPGDGMCQPLPLAGEQLAVLESLALAQASPLLAHRFQRWNQRLMGRALQHGPPRDRQLSTIVIPVYGDPAELDCCLASVRAAAVRSRWQVMAVMNDDTAATRQVLARHRAEDSRIQAVWPGENTQFALGCNLGAIAGRGELIVLLNNDCRVADGWLDALVEPLRHPAIAAVQPRLVKPDGRVQSLGVVFSGQQTLGYPLYAGLSSAWGCTHRHHRLQALTGACLAFRFADLLRVGGLDCLFINSQEDVDLCLRLLQLPDREYCLSTAATTVVHAEARAPGRFGHSRWSRHRFVQRWQGRIQPDDLAVYQADGVVCEGHRRDAEPFEREGIGAGRAILMMPSMTADSGHDWNKLDLEGK
jgi:GT2 family glycosyltransferase